MADRASATTAMIAKRRELVAEYRLQGLSLQEVADKLAEGHGIINPQTGKPYSAVTIHKDEKVCVGWWRANAEESVGALRARQVAELRRARRKSWKDGDMQEVRLNIESESKLLGTRAPEAIVHRGAIIEDVRVTLELPSKGSGWELVDGEQERIEGPAGSPAEVPELPS